MKNGKTLSKIILVLPILLLGWQTGYAAETNIFPAEGYVGIGTTAPSFPLDIEGNGGVGNWVRSNDNSNASYAAFWMISGGSENNGLFFASHAPARTSPRYGTPLGGFTELSGYGPQNKGLMVGTWNPVPVIFGTNNAEVMRLSGNGNVGVGTATPGASLDVNGGIRAGSSAVVTVCNSSTEGTQRYNYSSHNIEFCNGTSWIAACVP